MEDCSLQCFFALRLSCEFPSYSLHSLPSVNPNGPILSENAACPYPAWTPPGGVRLTVLPDHPCSYIPGRMARSRALWAERMAPLVYQRFMDAGFRRSGKLIYQPICSGCRACLPLRVPVKTFKPDKTQKRCIRRNADLSVTIESPDGNDERWELYQRYIAVWHGGTLGTREEFESFLYDSPVETLEFCYRDPAGRLVAVGLCDVCADSVSSVYFYFDPGESGRSLGTYGALTELEFAKNQEIPSYYLGYWIDQCAAMRYKANYRPHEVLDPDDVWRHRE